MRTKDVHPAIVVVIEEGAAAADGFEDVVIRIRLAVDDGRGEAGLLRDVGEMGVKGPTGRCEFRLGLGGVSGDTLA